MAMTRCLDCNRRTRGSRCPDCQRRRDHYRNQSPAQQARLSITRVQRQRVYARDGYRCVNCGKRRDLTLEHLVPLAVDVKPGYGDEELVTRCRRCNSARGSNWATAETATCVRRRRNVRRALRLRRSRKCPR
jgi:5-methylcytosine-specific restriction endonuclease McrA